MATSVGLSAYSSRVEAIPSVNLNSLANNSNASGTNQIVNTVNPRYDRIMVDIYLASVDLSSQSNPAFYIWLLEQLDGTNYEDGSATINPARQPDIIIPLLSVNGAQRVKGECFIGPGTYLVLSGNRTGSALAASGNTIFYKMWMNEINN